MVKTKISKDASPPSKRSHKKRNKNSTPASMKKGGMEMDVDQGNETENRGAPPSEPLEPRSLQLGMILTPESLPTPTGEAGEALGEEEPLLLIRRGARGSEPLLLVRRGARGSEPLLLVRGGAGPRPSSPKPPS